MFVIPGLLKIYILFLTRSTLNQQVPNLMCVPESPGELVKYRFTGKASDSVNLWWRGTGIGVVNKLVGD